MERATKDGARETGPALESHYRFIIWLVPVLDGFLRSQRFLLGDPGSRALRWTCWSP